MHQQLSGSGKFLGQWLFWLFFIFFKRFCKKWTQSQSDDRKIKNDNTKTGITQVLVELQQKFFHQHWTQKWTKNCKLWVCPFHCLCLIRDYLLSKCQQNWAIFGKDRAQKPPKKGHFMDAASPRKFITWQSQMLY